MSDRYTLKVSKINGLLQALSPAEIPLFRARLARGKGDLRGNLLPLFDVLLPVARESGVDADKRSVFKRCFPGKKFSDQQYRYFISDLSGHLEIFIAKRGFEKDKALFTEVLSRELASRGAVKAYNSRRLDFETEREEAPVRDISYYRHCFESELIHLEKATAGMKRNKESNIAETVDYLDRFYLAQKLRLSCEIYNVRNVLAVEYKVFLLDEIRAHLKNKTYADTPVILVYYKVLMTLLESEQEEHFFQLRQLLAQHEKNFRLQELREFYQYVLNYCIKKINLGNIGWQRTLFEIFKTTIENGVLMSEGYLSHLDYKNIVTISLRQKEYDWVKIFIDKYNKVLLPQERHNAYIYNLANVYFNTGEYSKSLKLLQQVEFSDLYYQLDSKSILLKTWFELDETESFLYHASAFRIFLKRNKLVSDYQRTIYQNLIRYSAMLHRAGNSKRKIAEVRKRAEKNRNIADLQWLLNKIDAQIS
ncbi:MAG TPA: hypothetical protein VI731_10945 [Bacteroidia bacterium]|nr:hypothetical protein [Bacteroidia bacterium]